MYLQLHMQNLIFVRCSSVCISLTKFNPLVSDRRSLALLVCSYHSRKSKDPIYNYEYWYVCHTCVVEYSVLLPKIRLEVEYNRRTRRTRHSHDSETPDRAGNIRSGMHMNRPPPEYEYSSTRYDTSNSTKYEEIILAIAPPVSFDSCSPMVLHTAVRQYSDYLATSR